MKKRVIQIILAIIILTFIILGIISLIRYDKNTDIEELKEEYKITGDTELYEIETEYDGRKVLVIKADENYKVAFAGLIKKTKPKFSETAVIFEQNHPIKNGVWIEAESRDKILKYLNNTLESTYTIDEKGYLNISNFQKSENDNIIKNLINGNKQYILSINSVTYYIDPLTGEIWDNPYEELDYAQTYSYFKDESKMMIFITENKERKLSEKEIFESIIELVKQ